MTMTDDAPAAVGSEPSRRPVAMTDAQKRDAARSAWRDDPTVTGVELGRRFDMTEGWGRKQIRAARAAGDTQSVTPAPPQYGPPAPTAEAPRRVNGTPRAIVPKATQRRPKPAPRKPAQPPPERHSAAARALVVVTKLSVGVVAVVAAVTSYVHTRDLALLVGQSDLLAGFLPLAVDGLVVAGSTSLLVDRHNRRPGSPWAALAVVIGLASSIAANVVAVDSTLIDLRAVRVVMAAYAPVALAISGHLLLRMLDQPQTDRKDQP